MRGACIRWGFSEVESVRAGKYMEIRLEAADRVAAEARVTEMCQKLLANPVIEEFTFQVESSGAG